MSLKKSDVEKIQDLYDNFPFTDRGELEEIEFDLSSVIDFMESHNLVDYDYSDLHSLHCELKEIVLSEKYSMDQILKILKED